MRPAHKQERTYADPRRQPHTCTNTLHRYPVQTQGPAPFLPHLSPTLPFAPLIFHLSLILCLFYISIRRLFLLILTGEWGEREREREWERGSCPLWVAKWLPFERSNPLHHTSRNLLCSPIYSVGTYFCLLCTSGTSTPLFFFSSLLIRLFLLHLWLPLLSLIPPTSKLFNSCLWVSMFALSLFLAYLGGTLKYATNRNESHFKLKNEKPFFWERTIYFKKGTFCVCLYLHEHTNTLAFSAYIFVCKRISMCVCVCVSICCELLQETFLPALSGWVECCLLQQQSQSPLPTA